MAMHEFPPLLPDEVIERAKKLNPALLADGMKGLGILKRQPLCPSTQTPP